MLQTYAWLCEETPDELEKVKGAESSSRGAEKNEEKIEKNEIHRFNKYCFLYSRDIP